jgi:hypothetical protein
MEYVIDGETVQYSELTIQDLVFRPLLLLEVLIQTEASFPVLNILYLTVKKLHGKVCNCSLPTLHISHIIFPYNRLLSRSLCVVHQRLGTMQKDK